jgi:uncharacterized membrane protein YhhN
MLVILLPVLIATSTVIGIVADYRSARVLVYVFKPLSTILIIALAASACAADRTYQILIVIGLVFSLGGDVALMLPDRPRSFFIHGLVSFLIAHVFYIIAFTMGMPWAPTHLLVLLPFVAFGIAIGGYLWPHLGPLKPAVMCYITVILVMGWRAAVRMESPGVPLAGGVLAFAGAILFITSDLFLALDRFVRKFRAARAIVLGTYFTAQTLIALSLYF